MEWLIAIPVALVFALCALMMLTMMVRGWLGRGRHSGHGMMMCMSHGAGHAPDTDVLEDLKAQRDRLDRLIARAEGEAAQTAGKGSQQSPESCC